MSKLWRPPALAAVVVLAVSCGSATTGGATADPGTPVVPFTQFARGLETARYAGYVGRPGVAVRDEQAFEQMREYLLSRYRNARVISSYASGGAVFDCMPRGTAGRSAPPAATPPAPATEAPAPPSAAAAVQTGQGCPPGTIPSRRVTLDQLVRFADLESFLAKGPGGAGMLPPAP